MIDLRDPGDICHFSPHGFVGFTSVFAMAPLSSTTKRRGDLIRGHAN